MSRYLHLPNGTTWPDPDAVGVLAWTLRYAPDTLTQQDYALAASVIDAYRHLVRFPGSGSALRYAYWERTRARRDDEAQEHVQQADDPLREDGRRPLRASDIKSPATTGRVSHRAITRAVRTVMAQRERSTGNDGDA
jgi:hypothetical protein